MQIPHPVHKIQYPVFHAASAKIEISFFNKGTCKVFYEVGITGIKLIELHGMVVTDLVSGVSDMQYCSNQVPGNTGCGFNICLEVKFCCHKT